MGNASRWPVAAGIVAATAAAAIIFKRSPPAYSKRFAYIYRPGDILLNDRSRELLRLATLTAKATAADVSTLLSNKNVDDTSPEWFVQLVASPNNRRLLTYSVMQPLDSIDHDFAIYDMSTGVRQLIFSEHYFESLLNRARCSPPEFAAFLAKELENNVPASVVDTYDYKLSLGGIDGANIESPLTIAWVDDDTLYLRWTLPISVGGFLMKGTFDLQIGGFDTHDMTLLATTAPAALSKPSQPVFNLSPGIAGPAAVIHNGNLPVMFDRGRAEWQTQNGKLRTAQMVAGNIWTSV